MDSLKALTKLGTKRLGGEKRIIFFLFLTFVFLFILAVVFVKGCLSINYWNVFIASSVFGGILALAQSLAILGGGIDMSCGTIFFVVVLFAGFFMSGGLGFIISVLIILGIGAGLGLFNGTIISRLGASPIIVTIASLSFFSGISYVIYFSSVMKGAEQYFPPILRTIATARPFGITILLFWLILIALLIWVILDRTSFGRKVRALGSNPTAAHVSGVETKRVKLLIYLITGIIAAFGGLLYIGWSGAPYVSGKFAAGAGLGLDLTMKSIIIPFIGGISIVGGRGNLWGTFLAIFVFQLILGFVRLIGLGISAQQMLSGILIMTILVIYTKGRRLR